MNCSEIKQASAKQQYSQPRLQKLGLLRELTQNGSGQSSEAASDPCIDKTDNKPNTNCVLP